MFCHDVAIITVNETGGRSTSVKYTWSLTRAYSSWLSMKVRCLLSEIWVCINNKVSDFAVPKDWGFGIFWTKQHGFLMFGSG